MRITQLVALAVLALSACSAPLKVGTTVKPAKSQSFLACVSQGALNKAIELSVAQERAEVDAMFAAATCTQAPGNRRYRILSVSGDEVEVAAVDPASPKGMWTAATSFDAAP